MNKTVIKSVLKDLGPILWRNIFSLVAVIIGGLSLLLILLGDTRDGFFLGLVITINIIIGIVQELRSRVALEKLQATVSSVYNVERNKRHRQLLAENILIGDIVELSLGDQVPVDGEIIKTSSCEVNEAMLTGESTNITKRVGDKLMAGSIVVAGSVMLEAEKIATQSYLATMTESLKKYSRSLSPIQHSMLKFIQIMAGVLVVLAILILSRSFFQGNSLVTSISQIAAIAATIIAEGLVLTSTIFFTYGAVRMSRQKVLLQQINAIENLGRVATVCVDKTGTLTQNQPVFEKILCYKKGETAFGELARLITTYVQAEPTKTTTMLALASVKSKTKPYKTSNLLSFSSERKYAAFTLKEKKQIVIIGASDYFTALIPRTQKQWVDNNLNALSKSAKRVLLVATATEGALDDPKSLKNLSVSGLIVMNNPLKAATKDIVEYLQNRGVQILVISGDNAATVKAIAEQANIEHQNKIFTGEQIDKMSKEELTRIINKKPLFARVLPSQKEKIVKAAQKLGLTAMIGDGANDALAIKQADVGIAMFSGAPASRQIADVVLIKDSFAAIPGGIRLSDSIITTLEMVACLFFSRVWSGVMLLLATLALNVSYPFTPRNISLLNLCIIAFPIALWGLMPRNRKRTIDEPSFLTRTLPFSFTNGTIIAAFSVFVYYLAKMVFNLDSASAQTSAFICFAAMSVFTISIIPEAMEVDKDRMGQLLIFLGYIFMAVIFVAIMLIKPLSEFFGLTNIVSVWVIILAIVVGLIGAWVQSLAVKNRIGSIILEKFHHHKMKKTHTGKV